jgi:hypothetical protein
VRWLALLLIVATSAAADDRPTVAILGVTTGNPRLLKIASAIEDGLRARVAAKASPYRVKGTKKDVAAKLLTAECTASEVPCAAKLGADFGTDYALAGTIDRRADHLELVLVLVDVAKKQRIRQYRDVVAVSADLKKLARTGFDKVTGVTDFGELAIVANAPRGEVYLDGELVAALFEGRTTLTHLAQGKHRLGIQADGYRPVDVEIDIVGATKQMVLLEKN